MLVCCALKLSITVVDLRQVNEQFPGVGERSFQLVLFIHKNKHKLELHRTSHYDVFQQTIFNTFALATSLLKTQPAICLSSFGEFSPPFPLLLSSLSFSSLPSFPLLCLLCGRLLTWTCLATMKWIEWALQCRSYYFDNSKERDVVSKFILSLLSHLDPLWPQLALEDPRFESKALEQIHQLPDGT